MDLATLYNRFPTLSQLEREDKTCKVRLSSDWNRGRSSLLYYEDLFAEHVHNLHRNPCAGAWRVSLHITL